MICDAVLGYAAVGCAGLRTVHCAALRSVFSEHLRQLALTLPHLFRTPVGSELGDLAVAVQTPF